VPCQTRIGKRDRISIVDLQTKVKETRSASARESVRERRERRLNDAFDIRTAMNLDKTIAEIERLECIYAVRDTEPLNADLLSLRGP